MTTQLNESLHYLDMENQMIPIIEIDHYKSKIGNDSDFVTLSFTVKSKSSSDDLVTWFERGYEFVIDAENSPGEISPGKYIVFVELNRRSSVPKRVIEMLTDLDTLTGYGPEEWKLKIEDELYDATEENIKKHIKLSPHEYRINDESDLNEMRVVAGLEPVTSYDKSDKGLKSMQNLAGIY